MYNIAIFTNKLAGYSRLIFAKIFFLGTVNSIWNGINDPPEVRGKELFTSGIPGIRYNAFFHEHFS